MSDKNAFSDREMQIMAMAWQCFTEQPKVNYDKLAKLCNFSNVKSASNAWGAIKKKLAAQGTGGDAADGTTTPKATKVTPKKRGKKAAEEDDEDDDEEATPAKVRLYRDSILNNC